MEQKKNEITKQETHLSAVEYGNGTPTACLAMFTFISAYFSACHCHHIDRGIVFFFSFNVRRSLSLPSRRSMNAMEIYRYILSPPSTTMRFLYAMCTFQCESINWWCQRERKCALEDFGLNGPLILYNGIYAFAMPCRIGMKWKGKRTQEDSHWFHLQINDWLDFVLIGNL